MLAVVIKGGKNPHLARWFDFCTTQPHLAVRFVPNPNRALLPPPLEHVQTLPPVLFEPEFVAARVRSSQPPP
jgi:hypothetical protein